MEEKLGLGGSPAIDIAIRLPRHYAPAVPSATQGDMSRVPPRRKLFNKDFLRAEELSGLLQV